MVLELVALVVVRNVRLGERADELYAAEDGIAVDDRVVVDGAHLGGHRDVGVMRRDIKTDWTVREDVKAKLRASIKRLLRKYGYPPDQQPEAIVEVMRQMEAVAPRMAEER